MTRTMQSRSLNTEDFFIIRSPRLPLKQLYEIPENKDDIHEYLKRWVEIPFVKEALYISSPSLIDGIERWKKSPDSRQSTKFEISLIKYMIRMSSRPTPFGLFSGIHLGEVSNETKLISRDPLHDHRKTRLDMLFLTKIKEHVLKSNRDELLYIPNPSHYFISDEFRYIESYQTNDTYQYRLCAIESNEYLEFMLNNARQGSSRNQLTQLFQETYPEVTLEEISAYVDEFIAESVLIPIAPLPLTGHSPDSSIVKILESTKNNEIAENIITSMQLIKAIDSNKSATIEQYKNIVEQLKKSKVALKENRLFQTDLYRNFHYCSIDKQSFYPLLNILDLLLLLGQQHQNPFNDFITKFNKRYEGQLVPLDKLLDEESGIGFSNETGYEAPLIAGLNINKTNNSANPAMMSSILDQEIIRTLSQKHNIGKSVIKLNEIELRKKIKANQATKNMPASFAIMYSLFKDSDEGDIIDFQGTDGPSSANLIGRFAHLDDHMYDKIKMHLEREEQHSPDVVFAEIVHMPEGRVGNVIARPHLRKYEIVFMADSSLDCEYQIHINDLYVWIENQQVKLWSKRLNKQVIPRLTSAHNYSRKSLSAYKFLSQLQKQQHQLPFFSIPRSLASSTYVPRIMIKNIILSPKTWRIPRKDFEVLFQQNEFNHAKVKALREKYSLDEWLAFSKGDNVLQIMLDNALMIKTLLSETKGYSTVEFKEVLSKAFTPTVISDSGDYYTSEIILPVFNADATQYKTITENLSSKLDSNKIKRIFSPGSEWLSLKIYGGNTSVENLLVDALLPQITNLNHLYEKWFYIRYGDPDWHLRIRFLGEPSTICGELLQSLNHIFEPAIESGLIDKVEVFTYNREVERYGGSVAMELCESLFMYDSILILKALNEVDEDLRWRVVTLLTDNLLSAFKYNLEEKFNFIDSLRDRFGREFNESAMLRKQLGNNFKKISSQLHSDLQNYKNNSYSSDCDRQNLLFSLIGNWESNANGDINQLNRLLCEQKVMCPKDTLLSSILHMYNNRMFKAYGREHELVIYDYLRRYYFSELKKNAQS